MHAADEMELGEVVLPAREGPESDGEHVQHEDGRVELRDPKAIEGSPLWNKDLAPTRVQFRTWSTYTYAALWISMAHCIPTYMLASGLIGTGMNWWQALVTILIGNVIVLVPILLNSHPGTKYGIPFPVFARAAYGVYGANVPAVMRAIVACGWFGINAWIGGQALQTFFRSLWPGWPTALGDATPGGHLVTEWVSFALFWGLNILIVVRGMELLRKVENLAAPFVLVMTALLVGWAIWKAHGLGPIVTGESKFKTLGEFWPVFVPSVTAMVGFWATLSLNMPDFTRFGRSQKEQAIGQVVALPTTMTIFAAMGVIITSASQIIYGRAMWDPIELVGQFQSRLVVGISMFTVVIATLSVNIAANVVSPANDFAHLAPKYISFRAGGIATGVIGVLMMPWKLIADPSGYIFQWLLGYSGGLGSIAGVLVADYWLVHKSRLRLLDLYKKEGEYSFSSLGTNWGAIVATALGCLLSWLGLAVPKLKVLFDYAWFVGFFVAGAAYVGWMRVVPKESAVAKGGPGAGSIVFGVILLVAGLAVTALSDHVVWYGAIVVGLVNIVRGSMQLARAR
jgi:NCS1 family nucleobase:cation symporter-1